MEMKKNIYLISTLILSLLAFSNTYGQFSADVDGKLSIAPVNGGMSYIYPISNNSIDGYKISVNLSYITDMSLTAFMGYYSSMNNCPNCDTWHMISATHPGWTIGVNGFAVNVFSLTHTFLNTYPTDDNTGSDWFNTTVDMPEGRHRDDLNKKEVIWMVNGYDFCNRMEVLTNANDYDVIRILKASGGILELKNPITRGDVYSSNDPSLYTGTYYEDGINSGGFAKVEFDERNYPSYIKEVANGKSDSNSYKPRVVRYYRGDGLEYVFREFVAPYGLRALLRTGKSLDRGYDTNGVYYAPPDAVPGNAVPTVFYLEEINSSMKNLVKFKRLYHNSDEDNFDICRGRSPVLEFADHKINLGNPYVYIHALGRTTKLTLDAKIFGSPIYEEIDVEQDYGALKLSEILEEDHGSTFIDQYLRDYELRSNGWSPEEDKECYLSEYYDDKMWFYEGINCNRNEISLITEILDPEDRRTTFNYEHFMTIKNNEMFDNDYLKFNGFRIDTITEPTKVFCFDYLNDTLQSSSKYFNTIQKYKKYDFINGEIGDKLTEVDYDINFELDSTSEYFRESFVSFYNGSSLTPENITKYYYKEYEAAVLNENSDLDYLNRPLKFTYLNKEVKQFNDTDLRGTISIKSMKSSDSINGVSRFLFLPTEEKLYSSDFDLDTILISHNTMRYEFTEIVNYPDTNFSNQFGNGISKMIISTINPASDSDTLIHNRIEYLHLALDSVAGTRTDEFWDKQRSDSLTIKFRKSGYDTTVTVFNSENFEKWFLPPVWYLEKYNEFIDGDYSILGATSKSYQTTLSNPSDPDCRRGALLADTVYGKGLSEYIVSSKRSYTGGRYRNFLQETENSLGAQKKLVYNYNEVGGYPTGKRLNNDNSIENVKIFREYHDIESPLAAISYIRNYNPKGLIETDSIVVYTEKTYFGQVRASIDANGWYYKNAYDSNGRATYVWHPYDFPSNSTGLRNKKILCDDLIKDGTYRVFRNDTLDHLNHQLSYGEKQAELYYSSELKTGNIIGYAPPSDQDTLPQTSNISTSEYVAKLIYVASSDDNIHRIALPTEAYLSFSYSGSFMNDCVMLNVKISGTDFDETVLIGCPAIKKINGYSAPDMVSGFPKAKLDISTIYSDLRALNDGEVAEISIKSLSGNGIVIIPSEADDIRPKICIYAKDFDEASDFTFAYSYDDSTRTTKYLAKIDDNIHTTSKNWIASFPDSLFGRYTGAVSYHGADNRLYETRAFIGQISNPTRVDTIVRTLSGTGQVMSLKDQLGNITNTVYFDNGKIESINGERGLEKNYEYEINVPENLLDNTGNNYQNFFGVCVGEFGIDELGKINAKYSDAFGRLRREVNDTSGLKVTTKYEYNTQGQLTHVINPKGDTTKYWYDDFGRVIYKHSPDIGYISSSYDKTGKLRFAQNEDQYEGNKLSFIEYDDLGRVKIVGEATIDVSGLTISNPVQNGDNWTFSRLTDQVSPDVLHYSGYGSGGDIGILTANSTIWNTPARDVPTFDPYFTRSDVTSDYLEFSTYDSLVPPYIVHPVDYYEPADTTAQTSNFEDLASFPQFIHKAVHYDEIPFTKGPVWDNMPSENTISNLLEGGSSPANLIGRQAVVAYRDHSGEPYHYVYFDYDPRGRVKSLLRYTENLGYDAVYYTYNSANQVLSVRAADPFRQYVTWYGYDDNGRVDSVWTLMGAVGSGVGFGPDSLAYPAMPQRPDEANIVYSYDRRGSVIEKKYLKGDVEVDYVYNPRGWIDSLVARQDLDIIFRSAFFRDSTGNITQQRSQHAGQDEQVQDYTYDGIQRITEWTDGSNDFAYAYDIVGNRLYDTMNTNNSVYNYSGTVQNRLETIVRGDRTATYTHNSNGALTHLIELENGKTGRQEEFYYTSGGFLKKFIDYDYSRDYEDLECDIMTLDSEKWDWRYRASGTGSREQKRLYYSPHGDSTCGEEDYSHFWAYYLLGSGGEQLAVYEGQQTAAEFSGQSGRRVYMRPVSYLTNGGELITRPDSALQYSISDNLGSARAVVSFCLKGDTLRSINGFDYKPYGDTLNQTTEEPRLSYKNNERDSESRYIAMGARQYDPVTGRFLSIDPLFESFRDLTPYQYAYNSPLIWKDPSGLAPVKEKMKDKIQWAEVDVSAAMPIYYGSLGDISDEHDMIEDEPSASMALFMNMYTTLEETIIFGLTERQLAGFLKFWCSGSGGGEDSSSDDPGESSQGSEQQKGGRTGTQSSNSSNNGQNNSANNTKRQLAKQIVQNFKITIFPSIQNVSESDVENALIDALEKVDLSALVFLSGLSIEIIIAPGGDIKYKYDKKREGELTGLYQRPNTKKNKTSFHTIWINSDFFTGLPPEKHEYIYEDSDEVKCPRFPCYWDFDLSMVLMHEFGHMYGHLKINGYSNAPYIFKENQAINFANNFYRKLYKHIPNRLNL